jgi:hypothetical protein
VRATHRISWPALPAPLVVFNEQPTSKLVTSIQNSKFAPFCCSSSSHFPALLLTKRNKHSLLAGAVWPNRRHEFRQLSIVCTSCPTPPSSPPPSSSLQLFRTLCSHARFNCRTVDRHFRTVQLSSLHIFSFGRTSLAGPIDGTHQSTRANHTLFHLFPLVLLITLRGSSAPVGSTRVNFALLSLSLSLSLDPLPLHRKWRPICPHSTCSTSSIGIPRLYTRLGLAEASIDRSNRCERFDCSNSFYSTRFTLSLLAYFR